MATYVPAKVSTQFVFYASLVSQANTKLMQVNPTIAAGDFKVSIDGGALANLGTLPTVTPAAGSMVKFTLSTSEMAGANATVVCIDAAGSEWCDLTINIPTAARQVDDLAFPATTGRSMVVDAAGLVDANAVKVGPSGSGTAQTAGDIPARIPAALTAGGNIKADALAWNALATVALPLIPTTAGRTLDVSATGEAGLDWANIGAPTTAVALTGTTIATTQKVDIETIKTQAVTAAAGVTFPTSIASPTNITAGVITTVTTVTNQLSAAAIATGVWTDTTAGDFTTALSVGKSVMNGVALGTGLTVAAVSGAVGSVTGAVGSVTGAVGSVTGAVGSVTGAVGSVTGNVGGNVVGTVASVVGAVGSVTGLTAATVHSDLDDIQARLPAALTANGNIKADTLRVAGTVQTAGDLATMITAVDDFVDTEIGTISTALNAVLALLDDPRGEPGQGAPAVNPDAMTKLDYIYKAWRNLKTNDGTTTLLYADNGTTVDHKQTTSEAAGTVSKAEWVTGP